VAGVTVTRLGFATFALKVQESHHMLRYALTTAVMFIDTYDRPCLTAGMDAGGEFRYSTGYGKLDRII
jgi:hypothetical protein